MEHGMELVRKQVGLTQPLSKLSNESKIALALSLMAMKRNGEWDPKTLEVFAAELSTLPFDDVMAAIQELANATSDREPSIPRFGDILVRVQDRAHPLRHLRALVREMAGNFGEKVTPAMLASFEGQCGHRTDADLDTAFRAVMRSDSLKRMPTTGQFLAACGTLIVRRDGTKA